MSLSRARQRKTEAIQGLVYALSVAGNLRLIAYLLEQDFSAPYRWLALLSGIFAFLGLRRFELLTPWLVGRQGSVGTRVYWAWVGLAGSLLLVGYITRYSDFYARPVLLLWFVSMPLVLLVVHKLAAAIATRFLPRLLHRRTAVVVFVNDSARGLVRNLRASAYYEVVGFFEDREMDRIGGALESLSYLGKSNSVSQYVRDHDIEVVFVVLPDDGGRRAVNLLDELGDTTASVYYVPDFLVINLFEAQVREIEGVTVLEVADTPFYGADGVLKQVFDLAFSITVLVVLAPLLLAIALLIKATSPGPILFRQKRYGLNGQRFMAYKFRSTTAGRTAQGAEFQPGARPEDPRMTPIGRFIRRTSIDELPQLLNVLKGEMSVVGPRPHAVAHNEYYRKAVKRYMVRHKVKPGMTGWAQVHGLQAETAQLDRMEERIRYDLEYIKNWSPMLDLKIVLMALIRVLRGKNGV